MKSLMLMIVGFFQMSNAVACPELSGIYQCAIPDSEKNSEYTLGIFWKKKGDLNVYEMQGVEYIADNVERRHPFQPDVSVTTTCAGSQVTFKGFFYKRKPTSPHCRGEVIKSGFLQEFNLDTRGNLIENRTEFVECEDGSIVETEKSKYFCS